MAAARALAAGGMVLLTCFLGRPPAVDAGSNAGPSGNPTLFLLTEGRLTAPELDAVARGRIVTKVIETSDRSEVMSFTVMRVKTTPDRVLDRFRSVETWRRYPWVLQAGRVGPVPSPRDLDALTLDGGDIKALARCRVNDCDIRLPADVIEQFRREVDWTSPGREATGSALFRRTLSSYAASYLRLGNAALFEYANNDEPVRVGESLKQLIDRFRFLGEASPDLYAYLDRFPNDPPPTAEDCLYWLKEKFWMMNVLSLNHSTVIDRTGTSGRMILDVSKQLYASHYYESSLSLTGYVEGPAGASYLFNLSRARADIRRGGFSWIERLLLNRLVRHRMESQFSNLRQSLEAA